MKKTQLLLALLRISLGWIFVWTFIDKVFGLGFTTASESAWLNGGSPTLGFLKFGTAGPFAPLYQSIAGHPLVDMLFLAGLLLIGISLILGIMTRIAGYSGALMMLLMYTAVLPPKHNPIIDDHSIYGLLLLLIAQELPAPELSLSDWWRKQPAVKRRPWLL